MVWPPTGNRILGPANSRRDPRPAAGTSAVHSAGFTLASISASASSGLRIRGALMFSLMGTVASAPPMLDGQASVCLGSEQLVRSQRDALTLPAARNQQDGRNVGP